MLPVAWLVLVAVSLPRKVKVTVPVPALRLVPPAWVMTALPASRCALTTPLLTQSLPVMVRLAFLRAMLALSSTERPAWRVSEPLLMLVGLEVSADDTVMSLLACKVTAVPAFRKATKSDAANLLLAADVVAKARELGAGAP